MPLNYLALGDSYTIGECVDQQNSFPFQVSQKLRSKGIEINDPQIIALTGWTTNDLIKALEGKNFKEKFDLVTLLIGVNNQYRGYSATNYRHEFKELLKTSLGYAENYKERLIVMSIPDWGLTPFAKKSGKNVRKISIQINAFNAINKEEAIKAGVGYLDINGSSRITDIDLPVLAADGLHPSGKLYGIWANELAKKFKTYKV